MTKSFVLSNTVSNAHKFAKKLNLKDYITFY